MQGYISLCIYSLKYVVRIPVFSGKSEFELNIWNSVANL